VCRRIQDRRGDLPRRHLADEAGRLPDGDRFSHPTPAHISGAIGVYTNTPHPHAAALFIDL